MPDIGLLLYFLILASAIIARWQRQETVTLVSRGMGISGVLGLVLTEELLLFVVGYPHGIGFGMLQARLMESSRDRQEVGATPLDGLKKLADLHSAGVLTDEEFAHAKAKLLASM